MSTILRKPGYFELCPVGVWSDRHETKRADEEAQPDYILKVKPGGFWWGFSSLKSEACQHFCPMPEAGAVRAWVTTPRTYTRRGVPPPTLSPMVPVMCLVFVHPQTEQWHWQPIFVLFTDRGWEYYERMWYFVAVVLVHAICDEAVAGKVEGSENLITVL